MNKTFYDPKQKKEISVNLDSFSRSGNTYSRTQQLRPSIRQSETVVVDSRGNVVSYRSQLQRAQRGANNRVKGWSTYEERDLNVSGGQATSERYRTPDKSFNYNYTDGTRENISDRARRQQNDRRTYYVPPEKKIPTAFKGYDPSLRVEYLGSGGVKVFRGDEQIKLKDAGFNKQQLQRIADVQEGVRGEGLRQAGVLAKSRAAKSDSFYIAYGRKYLGLRGDENKLQSTQDSRMQLRERAKEVKSQIQKTNTFLSKLDIPQDTRISVDPGRYIYGRSAGMATNSGYTLGSGVAFPMAERVYEAQGETKTQRQKEIEQLQTRLYAPYKPVVDAAKPVLSGINRGLISPLVSYTKGLPKTFVSIQEGRGKAYESDIEAFKSGNLNISYIEQREATKTKPIVSALKTDTDVQTFVGGTALLAAISKFPVVGTAVFGFGATTSFIDSFKSFRSGDKDTGTENIVVGVLDAYFAKTSLNRMSMPKFLERAYSFIDPKYSPVTKDVIGKDVVSFGRTDKIKIGEQSVSADRIDINLIPEGQSKNIQKTLTPEQLKYLKEVDPMEQSFRGGFGYSFKEQLNFAGKRGDIGSGQRGFFNFLESEKVAFKESPIPLERSFFGTPFNVKTGSANVRISRALTDETSIAEMLSGNVQFSTTKAKPQMFIFENTLIADIPEALKPLAKRASQGDKAAATEFFKRYEPFQLTPGDGQFKPFGFPGTELETTAFNSIVAKKSTLGRTFIKGKRVSVYSAELKPQPQTAREIDLINKNKQKTITAKEKAELYDSISKRSGFSVEEIKSMSRNRPIVSYGEAVTRIYAPISATDRKVYLTGKVTSTKDISNISRQVSGSGYSLFSVSSTQSPSSRISKISQTTSTSPLPSSPSSPISPQSPISPSPSSPSSPQSPISPSPSSPFSPSTTRSTYPRTGIPSPKYPRPPLTNPFRRQTERKNNFKPGFDVFVRSRGRFNKANVNPLSRSDALNFGSSIVGNTAAATFKLVETAGQSLDVFRGRGNLEDFYRKDDLFIEKASRRIKSPGELREITFKGIRSKREKKGRPRALAIRSVI